MTTISNSSKGAQTGLRRFTMMLSGEDALDELESRESPRQGLPHERFLLGEMVPLAPVLLLGQFNQTANPSEVIACLQPVHFHATQDHLILMEQNQIDLTVEESTHLLKAALPFIEEDFQSPILFENQHYWFIPAGPFASLASYSVDQAHGRNIDWWMPHDSLEQGIAKRWRKLQNEIQMLWHIGPVNEEREQRGMPSINSIWISGIGKLQDVQAPAAVKESHRLIGSHPILAGLAKLVDISHNISLDTQNLAGVFAWLEHPQHVWPHLSSALINEQVDEIVIIDFPNGKVRERIFTAKMLLKKSWAFWKKPEPLTWKEVNEF
ncbi:hypothetical protein [Polynucleobacter necessarius]|uniref:hypothetical protein n=1 Tax=Polynucleobacter necessarius TaxID=576610 RepID=UPI001E5D5CBA|nr:hypothetical protein [Polynucleobacter necessarius]